MSAGARLLGLHIRILLRRRELTVLAPAPIPGPVQIPAGERLLVRIPEERAPAPAPILGQGWIPA
jgi:hypothetical protein